MDWLKGMNDVVGHIEDNLTQPIRYESLSRIVGCSVYEFSRIFSFMAGMPLSVYIRRRRLSQAVFDLQNGDGKIIDIALKYGYESPTTFTRAFKELHGTTPQYARKMGVPLKTFPSITFLLTIRGVSELNFRIEQKESFQIMGLSGFETGEVEDSMTPLWNRFMREYNPLLWNNGDSYYTEPFWQVGAYDFACENGKTRTIVGAEYKGKIPDGAEFSLKTIPAAKWAAFTFYGMTGYEKYGEAYTRIITEWFPASQYARDESIPNLDVYPGGTIDENYAWEIWIPIRNK